VRARLGLLGEHTKHFFWPAHLSVFRNFDLSAGLRSPWPWLALFALLAGVVWRKRYPTLSFLVFWWPVTLLPCLDIRQLSYPLLADRFLYTPSLGLCLAIAQALIVVLPEHLPPRERLRLRWAASAALAVAGIMAVVQSRYLISRWRDNKTLLDYSLKQSPDSALIHVAQGWFLEYHAADLDGASREFETALRLNQASLQPMGNITYDADIGLGQVAYRRGQRATAIDYFQRAIRVVPRHGEAYQVMGSVYFPIGEYAKAAEYFAQAVRWDPLNLAARFYLGSCEMNLGRYREAAEQFRAAIDVDPAFTQAYEAEGRALEKIGHGVTQLNADEQKTGSQNSRVSTTNER
jgi:tetratricopeptide (TPR) repeat protein